MARFSLSANQGATLVYFNYIITHEIAKARISAGFLLCKRISPIMLTSLLSLSNSDKTNNPLFNYITQSPYKLDVGSEDLPRVFWQGNTFSRCLFFSYSHLA